MTARPLLACLVTCSLLSFVGACAQDEGPLVEDPLPEDPEDPLVATASIDVEGGSLELDDGARVDFPAGALTEAAELTLRRLGCEGIYRADSFGGCRYAVEGPQGVLADAYELSIPTRGPACASQQTIDGLVCMFGGQSEGELVTTRAGDFGEFTAWAENAIFPTDGCVMPDFEACGGELLGSWSMTAGCGTVEQLTNISSTAPNPYESCEPLDYYRGAPFSVSGALEFLESGYTLSSGFSIMKHEIVTAECLDSIGETCNPDCTLTEGVCECLFLDSEGDGASGDEVWSTDSDPTVVLLGGVAHPYCVEGDTLTLEWGPENDRYYTVYTRM